MLEEVHAYVFMSREHHPNLPLNWGRSVKESWEFKKPGGFCNENVTLNYNFALGQVFAIQVEQNGRGVLSLARREWFSSKGK